MQIKASVCTTVAELSVSLPQLELQMIEGAYRQESLLYFIHFKAVVTFLDHRCVHPYLNNDSPADHLL